MAAWFKKENDDLNKDVKMVIDTEKFNEMLNLNFCVASTSKQDNLKGILLQVSDNLLKLVSTDGRRLLIAESQVSSQGAGKIDYFIPLQTVYKIKQDSPGSYRKISVNIRDRKIIFESNYTYELQDAAKFPKYEEVVPAVCKNKVDINRQRLLLALNKLKLYMDNQIPKIIFDLSNNNLYLSVPNSNYQENLAVNYQEKRFKIAFNINYFLEILEKLPSQCDKLTFEFSKPDHPLVLKWQGYTYVILPIQIQI